MDGGGNKGKEDIAEEEYLREFLKNLQLTTDWLRKRCKLLRTEQRVQVHLCAWGACVWALGENVAN